MFSDVAKSYHDPDKLKNRNNQESLPLSCNKPTSGISTVSSKPVVNLSSSARTVRHMERLPAITISSSTTSNIMLLETSSRTTSLDITYSDSENRDHIYRDEALAKSASITTSDSDHSPLRVVETGLSYEDAVKPPASFVCAGARGINVSFMDKLDRLGKRLTLRMTNGRLQKTPRKLMEELEDLASVVKTMEAPSHVEGSSPTEVKFDDPLVQTISRLAKEELDRSVIGLGIRIESGQGLEVHEGGQAMLIGKARSFSEPKSNLRRHLDGIFGSRKPTSPSHSKAPPTSPVNWTPLLVPSRSAFNRPRQNSLPTRQRHVSFEEKIASISKLPTVIPNTSPGEYILQSLDFIVPHPRLPSPRLTPSTCSSTSTFPLSPTNTALPGLAGSTKFYSLRDMVKRR